MNYLDDRAANDALDLLAPSSPPDVDAALRQQLALQAQEPIRPQRWLARLSLISHPLPAIPIAAALVIALTLFTSPVRSLAAQFLTIFRVQDITPITVSSLSEPLPNLSKLGDMSEGAGRTASPRPAQVASLAAASSAVGFNVLTPSQLPSGLASQPVIATTPGQTAAFTFRAQKAQAYLASIGRTDITLPPKFDGATLQLHVEPAVALAYLPADVDVASLEKAASSAKAGSTPDAGAVNSLLNGGGVFVAETKSPTLDASGVSADELRTFLLSLPGIPAATKAQLQAIGDFRTTLPIPVTPGSDMHKVQIKGGGAGVAGRNSNMEMVVWVNNGIVYAAASPKLDEQAMLALAGSMK